MVGKDVIDPRLLGCNIGVVAQAEVNDSSMRMEVLKDELPEVAIVGNKDASLTVGEGKNVTIRQAHGIVAGDARCVMTERAEIGN